MARTRGRDAERRRLRVMVGTVAAVLTIGALGASPVLAGGPGNDAFRAAQEVGLSTAVELDTRGATVEGREPDPSCNRGAGASVWFTFTPESSGRFAVDTFQSGYDTTVAVYRGRWLGSLKPVSCSDDAGGVTSYAIFRGRAGVTYRIQVTGDRGAAGGLLLSVGYAPDLSPPNVGTPVPAFRLGARPGTAGLGRWHAWDRQSGVARYEVEMARGDEPWTPVVLRRPDSDAARLPFLPGVETRLRVRAINHQEMVSDWVEGAPFVPTLTQEDAPSVVLSAGWRVRPVADASGGASAVSVRPGARLTHAFTGRAIAVIAQRGPRRGEVRVFLDGELVRTVDLGRDRRQTRRVVFSAGLREPGLHTITLEVVGTDGRPRVSIDGFLTADDPAA